MEKILKNNIGKQIKVFAQTIEHEAYEQIKCVSNFWPYLDSKIRVMPDVHAGKGCTVGTTMTITDKVTPNLVGVDIGCGMFTVKLKEKEIDLKELDRVIKEKIPHGFNVHNESLHKFDFEGLRCKKHVDLPRASKSLGSLGGGNHFIEVGKDSEGFLYLVIHSGSRKLGGDVCKYYQDKAFKNANEMSTIKQKLVDKLKFEGREKDIQKELRKVKKPVTSKELAFLEGQDFEDYMNDMSITQRYASLNRKIMADIIISNMGLREDISFETIHNYIDFKRMILRKGAVSAEKDEMLLIPINMRDGSLICIGKGNEDWNYSAPHGAGRLMSRSKAKKSIEINEFIKSMDGIYTTTANKDTLDEAPQAYKSINEIVSCIDDTATVIDTIKPIYNFKSS